MNNWIIFDKSKPEEGIHYLREGDKIGVPHRLIDLNDLSLEIGNRADVLYYKGRVVRTLPRVVVMIENISKCRRIKKHLEAKGVIFANSGKSSYAAMCKAMNAKVFQKLNIAHPKTILISPRVDTKAIERVISYPVVLKELEADGGKQVYLCKNAKLLSSMLRRLEKEHGSDEYLLQQYIKSSHGKDIRVILIGEQIVGYYSRKAKNKDFRSNISTGGTRNPNIEIPKELNDKAIKIARYLSSDFISVDFMYGTNEFLACEINDYPLIKGFDHVTDLKIAQQVILHLNKKSLKKPD